MNDESERRVWQHAAGDTNRDYADTCLDWDVILSGPGYLGHWSTSEQKLRDEGWSSRKLTDLRRFVEEVTSGDLVVLRLGTSVVRGVGVVVGDYEWSDAFGDIDGWDLQHVRRVRWLLKCDRPGLSFETYSMKLGDTTQRLTSGAVFDWVQSLEVPPDGPVPKPLPVVDEASFRLEGLTDFLFDKGVASRSIESFVGEVGELVKIAEWYKRIGASPSESETIAYLVAPFLRALGWTPQKMAIEWNRVDVALFGDTPRRDEGLAVVVEAKKRDFSCLTAVSQARSYAKQWPSCRRLIVTDGIRFGVFVRRGADFERHAYMNLIRLRDTYPIYGCFGVTEAVWAMTPEWNGE